MNCSFKSEGNRFDFRVGAFIIRENKLLFIKNNHADYYYSVGGRVRLQETMEEAIKREVKEETSLDLLDQELAVLHENFFLSDETGERYHQIGMYYQVKVSEGELRCESLDELGSRESLHWIALDELEEYDIRPTFLKDTAIYQMPQGKIQHIIEKYE